MRNCSKSKLISICCTTVQLNSVLNSCVFSFCILPRLGDMDEESEEGAYPAFEGLNGGSWLKHDPIANFVPAKTPSSNKSPSTNSVA